eukprot:scaffold3187_cov361-Prasinococcus_capsulatus_cf.AAC.6
MEDHSHTGRTGRHGPRRRAARRQRHRTRGGHLSAGRRLRACAGARCRRSRSVVSSHTPYSTASGSWATPPATQRNNDAHTDARSRGMSSLRQRRPLASSCSLPDETPAAPAALSRAWHSSRAISSELSPTQPTCLREHGRRNNGRMCENMGSQTASTAARVALAGRRRASLQPLGGPGGDAFARSGRIHARKTSRTNDQAPSTVRRILRLQTQRPASVRGPATLLEAPVLTRSRHATVAAARVHPSAPVNSSSHNGGGGAAVGSDRNRLLNAPSQSVCSS